MPGQPLGRGELQPRPGPGYQYKTDRRALRRQQSGADLSAYYSTEDLRSKLRRRDGFGAKPRRPASAKSIGVAQSEEFIAMKSAAAVARPGSAAPGAQRRSTLKVSPSKPEPPDAMETVTRGQQPKRVVGLVKHDREFAWIVGRRTRPGSAIRASMDAAKKPEQLETEQTVERVLERVKAEYFPVSRLWGLRDRAAGSTRPQPAGAQVRRVASGSCLITTGQHAKLRERTTHLLGQITQLNRQIDLKSSQLERIKRQFVALSTGANSNSTKPVISFNRFVEVMKALGCGDQPAQADFLKRFYKIMDRDGDRTLDFGELLDGLAILLEGTARQKLQLFYVMYAYHDPNDVGKHYKDAAERAELEKGLSKFNIYRVLMAVVQHYCGSNESGNNQSSQAESLSQASETASQESTERTFERKQADFSNFHNSLVKDCDERITFDDLWSRFCEVPALLSCIDGQAMSLVAEVAAQSGLKSGASPAHASRSHNGTGAQARSRRGEGRSSRKKQPRRTMRFNRSREGLDVMGAMERSRDDESKNTSQTVAAKRVSGATEATLQDKVGLVGLGVVEQEVNRRSLAKALSGVVNRESATVEAKKTIQKAAVMEEAVKTAEECLASGVVWEWHFGDRWEKYDPVTEKSLEMAFHSGLHHVTLSTAVCKVGEYFQAPAADGKYLVTMRVDEEHPDMDQNHLPHHLRLDTGLPANSKCWRGLSQLNTGNNHRRPVRRICAVDLVNITVARLHEMAKLVMRESKDHTVDTFSQASSVGLRSPITPVKSAEEAAELERARLSAFDMRHTFDFLGLTSHDLEVANIINHMVPDGQGAYSVVAVLKAVRDKRKKAAAKSKNLEESKQKSEGRRRLQTSL